MNRTARTIDCKTCRTHFADLLLDEQYRTAHAKFAAHLDGCAGCAGELAALQRTFALLDEFAAPEPSAYFDSRLQARLREAEAARPEGLLERAYSFFAFSTGRHLRPAMAGVLGFVLLLGTGTTVYERMAMVNTAASPTVNDLRILDNNAQALQQMDQLLNDGGSGGSSDDAGGPPTT